MNLAEIDFELGDDYTPPIKVSLDEAFQLLDEVKKRHLYFHSIEGFRIDVDGYQIPDMSISKLGIRGEDQFSNLNEHYKLDKCILLKARSFEELCIFEVWLSSEDSLPKKNIQI